MEKIVHFRKGKKLFILEVGKNYFRNGQKMSLEMATDIVLKIDNVQKIRALGALAGN